MKKERNYVRNLSILKYVRRNYRYFFHLIIFMLGICLAIDFTNVMVIYNDEFKYIISFDYFLYSALYNKQNPKSQAQ
jgi:hypothetical protein